MFVAGKVYDGPGTRAAFVEAVADHAHEPLLLMELTDDLLDPPHPGHDPSRR